MLLNKKFFVYGMLFLLFASIASAEICEVDRVKQVLKKILFIYYTEPNSVPLTKDEVKDMLVFYLSISDQNLTVDCSAFGSRSNKPISDVVSAGENVTDRIPVCADGTKYGECSKYRPAYCYSGAIYQKCDKCGCPEKSVCGKSGKCEPAAQNVTCSKDIDCGQSSFTGDYYCVNNYIYKNYVNYSCVNSGTINSRCSGINGTYVLAYCNPNLNQSCVAGQSYCKLIITNASTNAINQTASNQTSNQTSLNTITVRGRYVDKFSGRPLQNIGFSLLKSPSTDLGTFYTDSNGYFSVSMGTTDITEVIYKVLAHHAACYMGDNGIVIGRYPGSYKLTGYDAVPGSLYVWINYFDVSTSARTERFLPVSANTVDVGDVPLWPSADFILTSDIPVKFSVSYPEEGRSSGNVNYLAYHYSSGIIPLNYNVRAQLTDSSGNAYYSPYAYAPLSRGCGPVGLSFFNRQFLWNSSNQSNPINQTPINQTPANQTNQTCIDSDGGKNYYVKGSVPSSAKLWEDYCDGAILHEFYCNPLTTSITGLTQDFYTCPYGCINGACISNQTTANQTNQTNQTALLPDLIVSDITFVPANPTTSDYIKVLVTFKNIGTAGAVSTSIKLVYWSPYLFSATMGIDSLAPGSSQTVDTSTIYGWDKLKSSTAGTYIFNATADIFNAVSESNENNNILTKSLTVLPAATNQTGLKGLAAGCTSGVQCSSGYCVSMPLDNSIGNCTYYGGDRSVNYTTCAQGYYPTLPCQCGGVAIHAGACNNGIFYWPPTQSGSNVGAYCTDGNTQCKTGICFFNACSYAVKCGPQSPGYCANHEECLAYGASC